MKAPMKLGAHRWVARVRDDWEVGIQIHSAAYNGVQVAKLHLFPSGRNELQISVVYL